MEKVLESVKIGTKILARSNALWDILLATEEEAKMLARSTLALSPPPNLIYGNETNKQWG